jgi:copper chaperone NosL
VKRIAALAGRTLLLAVFCAGANGCAQGSPAALDTAHDQCAQCRMVVSNAMTAAQIAAPLETPRFFDDFGCLRKYLEDTPGLSPEAAIFVTDHRTGAWVRGDRAIYTRARTVVAPMGLPVIAHDSPASRDGDPAAAAGVPMDAAEVIPEVWVTRLRSRGSR